MSGWVRTDRGRESGGSGKKEREQAATEQVRWGRGWGSSRSDRDYQGLEGHQCVNTPLDFDKDREEMSEVKGQSRQEMAGRVETRQ